MYTQIIGQGQSIVALHGWGMNHTMMMPIAKELGKNYQVYICDLFGFGKSEEIPEYHEFNDYIEAFHKFICEKQINEPILLAHSFGARLAFLYAAKYPVKALIVTGAAGLKAPLSFEKKIRIYLHKHRILKNRGSLDYQKATDFQRKVLLECVNMDLSDTIKQLNIPMLIIWGEKDLETPLWMAKKIHECVPTSTLLIFKGEDHFAYYHEPLRFAQCTHLFLEAL